MVSVLLTMLNATFMSCNVLLEILGGPGSECLITGVDMCIGIMAEIFTLLFGPDGCIMDLMEIF